MKRPALAQRSMSSNTFNTLRASPANAIIESSDYQPQKAPGPKPPRPHVVGGNHRSHVRNLSLGKNLNKLQKAATAQNLIAEATTIGPSSSSRHQRKKSAPVTPGASPHGHHVRWDGSHPSLGDHKANTSMRKNHSTPALRRNNTSGVLGKKALVTERLHPASAKGQAKKKVVGFELGDSESEEWEDSTQSPESTRRSSIAPGKDNNAGAALVDPLTFVKRPYPQTSQGTATATSLPVPDPTSDPLSRDHLRHPPSPTSEEEQQPMRTSDHEDIATRLLSQSRPSRAPPAMSSISAVATPPVVDLAHQAASLTTLALNHDPTRRPPSSASTSALLETPGVNPQATSSSIEGGVSRFIMSDIRATSRIDSDPNTPSSFLPHYRPQNLSSPSQSNSARKVKATSPPPRRVEPPSRTQQKLWLQRTAALTTSPPDPHGGPDALPASAMDPAFMAASHPRSGMRPYEGGRGAMNGSARVGGAAHDLGAKHVRKLYDKTAAELNVVRRFQSPTKSSFDRVNQLSRKLERPATGTEAGATKSRAKNMKSVPSFHGQFFRPSSARKNQRVVPQIHDATLTGSSQPVSKNVHQGSKDSTSHVYFQDHDDVVNIGEQVDRLGVDHQSPHSQRASHPISPSTDAPQATDQERDSTVFLDENELLLRRVWDSRELASSH